MPFRSRSSRYTTRHGQGYTTYEHQSHGIAAELTQFVPLADPLKISRLKLVNKSARARRLAITSYVEWTLGASRATAPFIVTSRDEQTSALYARNPRSVDFSERVAFLDMGGREVERNSRSVIFDSRLSSLRCGGAGVTHPNGL